MANIFDEAPTLEVNKTSVEQVVQGVNKGDEAHAMSELQDIEGFRIPSDIMFHNNQLLTLADPILSILLSIPRQAAPYDINYFRLQMLDLLRDFKVKSINLDYHPSVIEKSVYVLCAALDEEIAHTPWGKEKGWVNHSLLSSMFTQRNGGEIFFVLLDKACQQPKILIDFIKLVYVLLMLGFKGKYSETDQNELYEIKTYVFSLIEHYDKDNDLYLPKDEPIVRKSRPFVGLSFKYIIMYLVILLLIIFFIKQFKFLFITDSMDQLTESISHKIVSDERINFKSMDKLKVDYKVDSSNSNASRNLNNTANNKVNSNANSDVKNNYNAPKDPNSQFKSKNKDKGSKGL